MKLQRKMQNGTWVDESNNNLIDMVLERESWVAPRYNRTPMTTQTQVLEFLAAGNQINFDSDHYAKLRDADAVTAVSVTVQVPEIRCHCGHYCQRSLAMSTSRGVACSDCYDQMSQ